MAWWQVAAQVASAALPVIGKLFGKDKDETTSGRIDLKQLVADAEAAGFNPLTVLRNGGAAGYTQTHHPALSTGAIVGEALGSVAGTLAAIDPHAEAKRLQEAELFRAQLENLQANTALQKQQLSIGGVPTKTADVKNLYEPWIDNSPAGRGKTVWLVNSEAPDSEQIIMPALATEQPGGSVVDHAGRGFKDAAGVLTSPETWVRSRPLTDEEKKRQDEGWWPSWLPSVAFE